MPENPQATLGDVSVMAERNERPAELVEPGTEGSVQCQSPGCGNWFVKRSGRHIYCKAANCTYKRGTLTELELEPPVGAALELLRRLQEPEGGGDVGPEVVGPRLRSVTEAQRRGDTESLYGSLLDAAVALVAWADRVRSGTMPERPPAVAGPSRPAGAAPAGLVQAVLSSHRRTVMLADTRVAALWAMLSAKEAMEQAAAGAVATVGTADSVSAQEQAILRRIEFERAERALQSVEAAWSERKVAATELEAAGGPARNGGANGNGRRAA